MIVFFVLTAVLAIGVAAALARPLLTPREAPPAPEAFNAGVYRDQLAELDREVARGELSAQDEAAARAEIARRLLAAQAQADAAAAAPRTAAPAPRAAFALLAAAPLAAGALYLAIGEPGAPDQPLRPRLEARSAPPGSIGAEPMHAEMTDLVEQLKAKLAAEPDRADGWALLARSLARLDRYDEAVDAYRRALALTGDADPALAAEYAEARIVANDGVVDMEAFGVFRERLAADPTDPQARYYLALAKAQGGEVEEALADWRALLADSPAEAPWRAAIERQIAEATGAERSPPILGTPDVVSTGVEAPAPRGPTADDIAAAAEMSAADQTAMIEGMVAGLAARLEARPDDPEGWRRLARSYGVLGQPEQAASAYERLLTLAPDDADALWATGSWAAERGDADTARARWTKLAESLDAGSAERAEVEAAIEGLE